MVGAILMVRPGQDRSEVAQDRALGPGIEIAVAPQGPDDADRLVRLAELAERAGVGQLARVGLRRPGGEKRQDLGGAGRSDEKLRLLAIAEIAVAGPARMRGCEGGERGEGRMRIGPQRRPFQGEAAVGVGLGPGEGGEAGEVALAVGDRRGRDDRRRRQLWRRGDAVRRGGGVRTAGGGPREAAAN